MPIWTSKKPVKTSPKQPQRLDLDREAYIKPSVSRSLEISAESQDQEGCLSSTRLGSAHPTKYFAATLPRLTDFAAILTFLSRCSLRSSATLSLQLRFASLPNARSTSNYFGELLWCFPTLRCAYHLFYPAAVSPTNFPWLPITLPAVRLCHSRRCLLQSRPGRPLPTSGSSPPLLGHLSLPLLLLSKDALLLLSPHWESGFAVFLLLFHLLCYIQVV